MECGVRVVERAIPIKISITCYPDELLTPTVLSYSDDSFEYSKRALIGTCLPMKKITLNNNKFRLFLADFSTKPHFGAPLRFSFLRGSAAAVFAYSKSNRKFLNSALTMYRWFKKHIPLPVSAIAFLGLHADPEIVSQKDGEALAQELHVDFYEMAVDDLQALDTILKSLLLKVMAQLQIEPCGN